MDSTSAPSFIEHAQKSVAFTPHDTKWLPSSASFACAGVSTGGKGSLSLYQLNGGEIKPILDSSSIRPEGIKCITFGASSSQERHMAMGDFGGSLSIFDCATSSTIYSVEASSEGVVNAIDGIGGSGKGHGAPELVTASKDGSVRVWDPRVDQSVVTLEPETGTAARDCWTVAFGNSYNDQERCVCAGYDNGDLKLFDLNMGGKLRWETNCNNGIASVQFDRPDIEMNKLVVTTLESKFNVYDMRTQHQSEGFSYISEKAHRSTIWLSRHLPQNRDIFATCGGNGGLNLYKYNYPMSRTKKHVDDGAPVGVMGNVELLNSRIISTQPIVSFDWSPDKNGLACMAALDQVVRVYLVTKLNKY